ncbi:hypothetical protein F5Y15DRAFT_1042 [Xylariaceae sp. FL0016]|nr:hypothetical protein F5Y15DRAFT_1042 [Xylariaceae sp. FL0016]
MDTVYTSSGGASRFPYPVHTGLWTDWSDGQIMGSTLTLTQGSANLLIAFVALWAALIAGHIWKIVCFGLHSWYSTPKSKDVLHHQRQVLLRNNAGAGSSAFSVVEIVWAWRRMAALWSLLPLLACSVILAILLAVASGFSSSVATGNKVLIRGLNCGIAISSLGNDSKIALTEYQPFSADFMNAAAIEATQCYENSSTSSLSCGTFVKPRLNLHLDKNISCPFGDLCASQWGNLQLDTGLLDSHEDLGLNAPKNERFSLREVSQCAPLRTDGYTDQWNISDDRSYTRYWYGQVLFNFTYMASNDAIYEAQVTKRDAADDTYSIKPFTASWANGELTSDSNLNPIADLRTGGDISVMFLSAGGVVFTEKTLDPWYKATHSTGSIRMASLQSSEPQRVEVYGQDEPGSPMACTRKVQFCSPQIPGEDHCTALMTMNDAYAKVSHLDEAASQRMTWTIDALTSLLDNPESVVNAMGEQSLLSRRTMVDGVQGPLPDNQWQLDVEHWHNVHLAAYQKLVVDVAAGSAATQLSAQWIRRPQNKQEMRLCNSQKVVSTAHVSFSVFGLLFILLGGLLIITLSFCMESLAALIQRKLKMDPYSRIEWISNSTLQLQRLAHEELGIGEWTNGDGAVPTTRTLATLAPFDIANRTHPRLLIGEPQKQFLMSRATTFATSDEKLAIGEEKVARVTTHGTDGTETVGSPGVRSVSERSFEDSKKR